MPKPYPREFRDDVVRVARNREPGVHLKQIATDFGISESCLNGWLKAADVEDGRKPGVTGEQSTENREAAQAGPAAGAGERSPPSGRGLSLAGQSAGKMMYPLVRELAARDALIRVPVTVTCRVLKLARQPYYRWLAAPVTDADLEEAYRANALFDAHKDDPEFGYRFLVDEARDDGVAMADRTAWRICSDNGWWSAFGKKKARGKGKKPGPPVHDDLVQRNFTAQAPNRLWLGDITEHWTGEGKLYVCAFKDVYSNRIVGYSIDSRMKSRLAVAALNNAVGQARRRSRLRGPHGSRIAISQPEVRPRSQPPRHGRIHGQSRRRRRQRSHGELLQSAPEERPQPAALGHPRGPPDRDRDLDRTDLPPPPQTGLPGPIDPHRVRDHHDRTGHSGRVTQPVT